MTWVTHDPATWCDGRGDVDPPGWVDVTVPPLDCPGCPRCDADGRVYRVCGECGHMHDEAYCPVCEQM